MNLQELQQVKKDLANGIIISRSQWIKVLDAAIEAKADTVKIWNDWHGGPSPVERDDLVHYVLRDGYSDVARSWTLSWGHDKTGSDIVKYEVIK